MIPTKSQRRRPAKGRAALPHTRADSVGGPRRDEDSLVPLRSTGKRRLANVITLAVVVGVAVYVMNRAGEGSDYKWDFAVLERSWPQLLDGAVMTLQITALSLALSLPCGLVVAAARMSTLTAFRVLSACYIEVVRNTPVLVQIVWVFYALPIILDIRLDPIEAGVLTLTVNTTAYMAEAFRAGVQAVPKSQVEAAAILGLTDPQRWVYVLAPQAVKNVLPVLVFLGVLLFKNTSLVAWIGVNDLMSVSNAIAVTTYRPLEVLTVAAMMYLMIALPVTMGLRRLEIRMASR